jgi:NADPH:quinone reductase-like Zn-dependent oxidoreductase
MVMKTIRAARLEHHGGPEAVRIEHVSLPEPMAGGLLVRVHAAGVNPSDWKLRAGLLQEKMPLKLPITLSGDFSGIVEAVGPGVANFKARDHVYGYASPLNGGSGSFAEFVIAPAGSTSAKPKSLGHTEAGALPLPGVSALQALTEHLRISAGQKVLIHGGAGAIGSTAIQLAKHLGAHVATSVRVDDIDYVKGLGADTVIDYKAKKFEEVVRDLDAVFDTVGGDTYVRSFTVLKRGGRLVSMLEQPREDMMTTFGVEAIAQFTQVSTERLTRLAALVDLGALKVRVGKTFTLQEAAAALEHLEKNAPRGRVVLTIE